MRLLEPRFGGASTLSGRLGDPLREPRVHRRDNLCGDLRVSDLELSKLRSEQDEQADRRRAPDGRRAPPFAKDRDLAEEVPASEHRERIAVGAYLGGAVEDDEERVARRALANETYAFAGVLDVKPARKLLPLRVVE